MKACFFRRYGGPEVLEYGELPDPVPAPHEGRHLRGKLVLRAR